MLSKVKDACSREREHQKATGCCNIMELDGMSNFIFYNRNGIIHNPAAINRAIKRLVADCNAKEIIRAKREKREPVIVPMFMQSSMTPEFAEAVFRAADSSVKGLTPIFSYFVILIGFLHIYNKRKNDVITISDAMSLMVPYAIAFTILWLIIILAFYIIGIPIGIGTGVML